MTEPLPELEPPCVAVVVATRDRAASLARLLEALERQSFPRARSEIVVVDDGSRDDTAAVLEAHRRRSAGPFAAIALPVAGGPAAARNRGWRATSAPIVAFTDDDCEPDPGWLEAGVSALGRDAGIVMGGTRPAGGAENKPFSRTMRVDHEDGRYPTCNVFYRRAALERAGGFDESFRHACGEDTDLAWRVKQLGYASVFAAEARVTHEVRPSNFLLFLRERRRFADQILLVRRHPDLRRLFYRRYFYRRSHLHALATVILLAVAMLGAPRALVVLPFLWIERLSRSELGAGVSERLRIAAELVVADVWEFAVFCYWSARYRTLLL